MIKGFIMKKAKGLLLLTMMALPMLGNSFASEEKKEEAEIVETEKEKVEVAKPEKVEEKTVYGHDEIIILPEFGNLQIHAKLDTGARTASLSARDLKIFTKNKDKWVRFQLEDSKKTYEFPIKRMSRIKKRAAEMESPDDTYTERPVIELEVCLGSQRKKLEVNLTDRSRFKFQFLIGKIGLTKLKAIVDPSVAEISTPSCPTVK